MKSHKMITIDEDVSKFLENYKGNFSKLVNELVRNNFLLEKTMDVDKNLLVETKKTYEEKLFEDSEKLKKLNEKISMIESIEEQRINSINVKELRDYGFHNTVLFKIIEMTNRFALLSDSEKIERLDSFVSLLQNETGQIDLCKYDFLRLCKLLERKK